MRRDHRRGAAGPLCGADAGHRHPGPAPRAHRGRLPAGRAPQPGPAHRRFPGGHDPGGFRHAGPGRSGLSARPDRKLVAAGRGPGPERAAVPGPPGAGRPRLQPPRPPGPLVRAGHAARVGGLHRGGLAGHRGRAGQRRRQDPGRLPRGAPPGLDPGRRGPVHPVYVDGRAGLGDRHRPAPAAFRRHRAGRKRGVRAARRGRAARPEGRPGPRLLLLPPVPGLLGLRPGAAGPGRGQHLPERPGHAVPPAVQPRPVQRPARAWPCPSPSSCRWPS